MLDELYNRRILALAADIPRLGRLAAPQGSATARSRLCGSTVTVDVTLAEGRVAEFAQEVRACALGQASSSVMGSAVIGSTLEELRAVRAAVTAMLKEDGPAPEGRWAALEVLAPVRDHKARHASTLLTFDAVVQAVEQATAPAGELGVTA